jgi:phosphoribosylglycinamide formyltransferase 1
LATFGNLNHDLMKNIAIFASGNGTNAQRIAEYFRNSDTVNISLILSNKPDAFVLKRAEKLGIPTTIFNKKDFYESGLSL